MPVKQSLKEHFENGRLDLSMAGLTEVPVKEIAAIPKATSLDLSSNRLTTIGKNFPLALTHLVYLDLAKNQLVELPENFGLLVNLKHLDLYSNQLTSLPLSFGNLKALRWLDLKQNLNLMPKLAQIAGPCLDSSQCAEAAKNVVELLAMMNKQVEVEKQRRQEQRQKQLEENEKKAQEIKKEQQLLKKKNKKAKKEDAENAKLLDSAQNGNLQDGVHDNMTEEQGNGELDNLATRNRNDKNGKCDAAVPLNKKTSKQLSKSSKVVNFFGTLTKVIVVSTLLLILGLFILSLLDENYYNAARKRLIIVRNQISAQLPKPFLTKINKAFVSSRKYFWKSANHLGKLSIKIIQDIQDWYSWISTHETVQLYFEQIKSGWQVLWIRISEIYRTFLVDAQ